MYKSSKAAANNRVLYKIMERKTIKSQYIIEFTEHESFVKDSLFSSIKYDYCLFKKPDLNLKMLIWQKKEKRINFTIQELFNLLHNQVKYLIERLSLIMNSKNQNISLSIYASSILELSNLKIFRKTCGS